MGAVETSGTDCVVVGGGPGGMMLAYLLARNGVRVTLLEGAGDFEREFRGDTLSPAILDLLEALGLAEAVLELPHAKATGLTWHARGRDYKLLDYGAASRRHPFMMILSQSRFLEFLAAQARQYPGFELRFGARVNRLLTSDDGRVCGVAYRAAGTEHEVRAPLVVGADGRFSVLRRLAQIPSRECGVGNDLLWLRVPRYKDSDPWLCGFDLFSDERGLGSALNHDTHWQIGYAIPVGSVEQARARGVEPIKAFIHNTLPWLDERAAELTDFDQLKLLSIRITMLERWWLPGLLLIGDAAHVISPVGGYGIGLAVADAVEASNVLHPVLAGATRDADRGRALDEACALIEARRRPVVEDRQCFQERLEARNARARAKGMKAAMAMVAKGKQPKGGGPRPIRIERFQGALPVLRRRVGTRATKAIRMPRPILTGAAIAARNVNQPSAADVAA
jgi:2-polyprenyl-6-methoxyphenol hydroxylase-like FAD-dependent oxidoreductase